MPATETSRAPVETYLAELSRALSGPRRRRADLMAEARDSLEDATEAFEAGGLSRWDAEQHAVADFGELDEVVPGYRAELGIAQGRRTALALCLVMLAQPIIWKEGLWAWNRDSGSPTAYTAFLNDLVMVIGMLTIVGSVLALLASGIGLRYPAVRDRATRAIAVFALLSGGAVSVVAIALSTSSALAERSGPDGIAVVLGFVLFPLLLVGRSARRCLRLA
ncbi:permease prefix domain 1-containing protein [Kribbella voronezhensis]|uniref:permease prefix domain 1-containing protein n=1 Tax=Kribbella voronezhensis TaxID=2512212 RepID=UPI001064246C|nr:permease prefix domain 1-containing protein [Kribbella voronezhensis]